MSFERLIMFEFQYFLTAGLTMIGFFSAMPPRLLRSHLKNRRSGQGRPAQAGKGSAGKEGSGA